MTTRESASGKEYHPLLPPDTAIGEEAQPSLFHSYDAAEDSGDALDAVAVDDAMSSLAYAIARAARLLDALCDRLEAQPESATREKKTVAFGKGAVTSASPTANAPLDMGPLRPLLEDETISDILVNGYKNVYIERRGKVEPTNITFPSEDALFALATKIVAVVGRRIDPKRPLVDARLLDGSRVNIVAPPLAVDGLSLSIRKFAKRRITLEFMMKSGMMSKTLHDFLACCAKAKVNVIISGGTGSGKTTLMNAISQHISPEDRIVTIEDSAELQLQQPHIVRLETKEPERRGDIADEVSMRDLVKNALRMRPERIIVGEVRGPEAFDMIQAMNTGHDGSLTTIHANTPRDGLARLENMVSMANLNVPTLSIRRQIASAIHLMIQTARLEDGSRRVTQVAEIVGMEGDVVTMQDVFKFHPTAPKNGKIQGTHKWTGVFPRHYGLNALLRDTGVMNMSG